MNATRSDTIREALEHAIRLKGLPDVKADIGKGLNDLARGRVKAFDAERIVARGRQMLSARYGKTRLFPSSAGGFT